MRTAVHRLGACAAPFLVVVLAAAQGQESGAPGAPARTPRAAAPIDLTGQWVSLITEDWRYRMITPAAGDYQAVPMTPAAITVANAWDPKADARAGLQCKSYGAPALMHVAGRVRFTWEDEHTLRMDSDAGTQTRLFRFASTSQPGGRRTWQGHSVASWEASGRGRGAAPTGRSLKVVTTNLRAGYLRKNGVPYSDNAVLTEYFDLAPLPGGGQVLVVTAAVDDSHFLDRQFVVASQFKKETDSSKWRPTPCSAEW
jgi:hypothetical protein